MKDICYHIPKISSTDDSMRRMLASGSSLDEFDINFTLMGCSGISFKDLQNMVKRNQVEVGDYILTPYDRNSTPLIAWKVIDKNGNKVTLNTLDIIDFIPFSKYSSNNYQQSYIRKWMNNELPKKLPQSFISLIKPYSSSYRDANGDKFWLITIYELTKYFNSKDDRIKHALVDSEYFKSGNNAEWWLRGLHDENSKIEFNVSAVGGVGNNFTQNELGCSPACIF